MQWRAFGVSTLAYLKEQFPQACAKFDDDELRAMMALALRKSREHGFTTHAQILRYINVMYALGCEFEADPDYPWAHEIMSHPRLRPGSKIDRLVARTAAYMKTFEPAEQAP